ncbi:MFS transporter [Streptomyces sp. rh34]|uniref:MFS transporter n=1 Tax=Streptomyces sp. rh34 TaxID=2034272 RepID=UPI000BEF8197|nr:MFS transporter [Streptomyces sp. rh34]
MSHILRGAYGKFWLASGLSSLADGITLAAGPLLMAQISTDPAVVGGAVFAQQLPWLLFSLFSGAFVDRVDRWLTVGVVGIGRAVVMGTLAYLVWQGWATIPIVYAAVFLLGVGATLSDNAGQALLPSVVAADDLAKANAWLSGARMVGNQFGGPPLGGWLFVVAAAVPFGLDAACFALSALLMLSIRHSMGDAPTSAETAAPTKPRRSVRQEIGEGMRWLWHHRPLRILAITIGLMNITYGGAFAAYVLYARERLGLSEVGYGFLLAATAVGGVMGTLSVARLGKRFGTGPLLRVGLVVETLTYLVLAVTRLPWVAAATLVVFGAHAAIWGVVSVTLRQRITPSELFGRVNSVYLLFSMGGFALGSLLGGLIGQAFGITAPFWVAFVAMTVMTAGAWRTMTSSAISSEPASPAIDLK